MAVGQGQGLRLNTIYLLADQDLPHAGDRTREVDHENLLQFKPMADKSQKALIGR